MINENLILIPSYQPDETLYYLSKGLKEAGFNIVIVDDGSGPSFDNVFKSAEEFADVLRYETNRGKGYALRYGFNYIKEKYSDYLGLITVDGDGQHLIKDIKRVDLLLKEKQKTVLGLRSFNVKVPFKSKIGNGLSKFTQSLATEKYLSDNQCGLRGFLVKDIPLLLKIKGDRYEYEMRVINELILKEIPFTTTEIETIYENNNAKTHFRPLLDTFLIQKSIFYAGLISLISLILEVVSVTLFSLFVYKDIGTYNLELSMVTAFAISLLIKVFLLFIFYRPRHKRKVFFKASIYKIFVLVAYYVSIIVFTRLLNLPIYLTYIISIFLTIFPKYYLIKGVGVFLESSRG